MIEYNNDYQQKSIRNYITYMAGSRGISMVTL